MKGVGSCRDLEDWPQEWQVGAVAVGSNGRSGSQELLKEQKVPPVPGVGWAPAGGELLTQDRMSVGWEGGFLEKNFEHSCRKKFCEQLCLISVSAQMWVLVVCEVCSGRAQQCNSSMMDTGDVLLLYREKIWAGQDVPELPVERTLSAAWPQPVVASVTINVCVSCSR